MQMNCRPEDMLLYAVTDRAMAEGGNSGESG